MGGAVQVERPTQYAERVKVGGVVRVVRAKRAGDDQDGGRQLSAQRRQDVQGQLQVLARRDPHGQQEDGCGVQQPGPLEQAAGQLFQLEELGQIDAGGNDANLVRRQAHELCELTLAQAGDDHLGCAWPRTAQQIPGIAVVELGPVARGGPGQVVMPEDGPAGDGPGVKIEECGGEGKVLVERTDVVGDEDVDSVEEGSQLVYHRGAQRVEILRHGACIQTALDGDDFWMA